MTEAPSWPCGSGGGGGAPGAIGARAPTDDTGAYRLFGLEPGRYYLSVRPDDDRVSPDIDTSVTGLAPTYYPSTAMASEAQPIDVAAGAEAVADIALVATRVTTVSGEVFDTAGRASIGGIVMLHAAGNATMSRFRYGQRRPSRRRLPRCGRRLELITVGVRAFFDEAETMRIASTGTLDGAPAFSMPLSVSGERRGPAHPRAAAGRCVRARGVRGAHRPAPSSAACLRATRWVTWTSESGTRWGPTAASRCGSGPGRGDSAHADTPPGWMVKRLTFEGPRSIRMRRWRSAANRVGSRCC